MRSLQVSNAGFEDVNGMYEEITENVFEMERDNGRMYSISIDDQCPFAFNVWSIKRVDGDQEIAIYCSTAKDLANGDQWEAVVGSEPWPTIEFMSNEHKEEAAIVVDNEQRKRWKKGNDIRFWSRTQLQWLGGKITQIANGFVMVSEVRISGDDEKESKPIGESKLDSGCYLLSSPLLQCAADEQFHKRRLNKKQAVNVWSRKQLKWQTATITKMEQDFCFVECGKESRWIQRNSSLIQAQ